MGLLYTLDLFGVAVFAVSGALAAGRKRMDVFGVAVVALVTALGGGTIRDVLLGGAPVFWVRDPVYIAVASAAALATFASAGLVRMPAGLLPVFDAFGLGVFTMIGCDAALRAEGVALAPAGWVIVIMMGVTTGAAGGMVRDLLCGEIPLVLRREIYATAALLGGVTFVSLTGLGAAYGAVVLATAAVTIAVRLAAIRWHLSLPVYGGQARSY